MKKSKTFELARDDNSGLALWDAYFLGTIKRVSWLSPIPNRNIREILKNPRKVTVTITVED
jgi:hypothetical protein